MTTTSPVRPESAHPTRPAPPAQLEWLREEAGDWTRAGILTEEQAHSILGRYHAARRMSLARLLLTLGAVFVGFGIIWLVAANLDALPPTVRFLTVAALWVLATVGAELLAARRAHGGPVPSPVVHSARLLAALLFGGVVFQGAQSLQVPAYDARLVGLWSLGALAHGYVVRSVAPVGLGLVTGFVWVVWDAAAADASALGVLLSVAAFGIVGVSVAALHDARGPMHDSVGGTSTRHRRMAWGSISDPWRELGVVSLLGVLFTAALPFLDGEGFAWRTTLVVELGLALVAAGAAVAVGLARRANAPRLLWAEPLGAAAITGLAVLLLLWDAGADAEDVGVSGWLHAALAVLTYLVVASGVAVVGILRDRSALTVIALVAMVVFTTFQSFAVFARIIEGAWLFLVVGLILAGTGYVADRARRRLAASLEEGGGR